MLRHRMLFVLASAGLVVLFVPTIAVHGASDTALADFAMSLASLAGWVFVAPRLVRRLKEMECSP